MQFVHDFAKRPVRAVLRLHDLSPVSGNKAVVSRHGPNGDANGAESGDDDKDAEAQQVAEDVHGFLDSLLQKGLVTDRAATARAANTSADVAIASALGVDYSAVAFL